MIDKGLIVRASGILQCGSNRRRLNDAERNRQITRILRNLAAAKFAFFLEAFEIREHDRHQLQDDRRSDVRHDAKRKNREAAKVTAAEQIEDAERGALRLLEIEFQDIFINSRRGNVRADAIHRQQSQRKQDALPQIFAAEEIRECLEESVHALPCAVTVPLTKSSVGTTKSSFSPSKKGYPRISLSGPAPKGGITSWYPQSRWRPCI